MSHDHRVTRLLEAWRLGDEAAQDELMPLVYDRLRRLAAGQMRGERGDHTLEPTALVHASYLQLVGMDVPFHDRAHFFTVAARAMRRVLVDYAKARRRRKRGGGALRVTLDEAHAVTPERSVEIVDLDAALSRLGEIDERKARAVELHFFAGLTYHETADALAISAITVHRDLKLAKAWLHRELSAGTAGEGGGEAGDRP